MEDYIPLKDINDEIREVAQCFLLTELKPKTLVLKKIKYADVQFLSVQHFGKTELFRLSFIEDPETKQILVDKLSFQNVKILGKRSLKRSVASTIHDIEDYADASLDGTLFMTYEQVHTM